MVSTKGCFLTEEGSFFSNRYRQTQNALSTAAARSKSALLPNMSAYMLSMHAKEKNGCEDFAQGRTISDSRLQIHTTL